MATVAVLAVAACSSGAPDEDPDSSPGAADATDPSATPTVPEPLTPGPNASAVAAPTEVTEETKEGVDDYVEDLGEVLSDPSAEEELSLDTVTGAALEDLRNQVLEYEASGWKVVGEPKVVRHRVVEYYEDPREVAVVRACIDNSGVRVVDSKGREVPGSQPATPRSLNILTLVKVDGEWAVGEQRLARRPDC